MKIVNLTDFLTYPDGTVFSYYEPSVFGPLSIKSESIPKTGDFFSLDIASAIKCDDTEEFANNCDEMQYNGKSVPMQFEIYSRDGMFNKDQLLLCGSRMMLKL